MQTTIDIGPTTRTQKLEKFLVFSILLFIFAQHVIDEYRSPDGYLGRTIPPGQTEIVEQSAPAPYIYRQGIPQVRAAMSRWIQPGYAACAVDIAFGALAIAMGFRLTRGRRWGAYLVTLCLYALYPNDKPESVAMLAFVLTCSVAVLEGRHWLASALAVLAIPVRPELSVLFSASALVSYGLMRHSLGKSVGSVKIISSYLVSGLIGVAYLFMAKLVLWPDAAYPAGTKFFALWYNVSHPSTYPGFALSLVLGYLAVRWMLLQYSRLTSKPSDVAPHPELVPVAPSDSATRLGALVVACFIILWCVAHITVGHANEIRLAMPVLPLCFVLALRPESHSAESSSE